MSEHGWTAERVERLTHLWVVEELSCSQIGQDMGISRNAVIGKARRIGLPARRTGPPANAPRPRPDRRGSPLAGGGKKRFSISRAAALSETDEDRKLDALAEDTATPLPGHGVRFSDWNPTTCAYPHGDPRTADFRMCGAQIWAQSEKPTAYCRVHHKRCHEGSTRAKNALDRGFGRAQSAPSAFQNR